jgi:hypothetical protein
LRPDQAAPNVEWELAVADDGNKFDMRAIARGVANLSLSIPRLIASITPLAAMDATKS